MNALDPKTQAMLLKIRKGATASIKMTQLVKKIFPAIGFTGKAVLPARGETVSTITFGDKTATFNSDFRTIDTKTQFWEHNAIKWLVANTDFMDLVLKALGMEKHIPASRRSKDGTGTCPVCFRNIKLVGAVMVNHGYTQGPYHGYHKGDDCRASRHFQPYELSVEGTKWALDMAENTVERLKDRVKELKTLLATKGTITVEQRHGRIIRKVEQFDVQDAERNVETARTVLNFYAKMVAEWKLRDLPKENEPFADFVKD